MEISTGTDSILLVEDTTFSECSKTSGYGGSLSFDSLGQFAQVRTCYYMPKNIQLGTSLYVKIPSNVDKRLNINLTSITSGVGDVTVYVRTGREISSNINSSYNTAKQLSAYCHSSEETIDIKMILSSFRNNTQVGFALFAFVTTNLASLFYCNIIENVRTNTQNQGIIYVYRDTIFENCSIKGNIGNPLFSSANNNKITLNSCYFDSTTSINCILISDNQILNPFTNKIPFYSTEKCKMKYIFIPEKIKQEDTDLITNNFQYLIFLLPSYLINNCSSWKFRESFPIIYH